MKSILLLSLGLAVVAAPASAGDRPVRKPSAKALVFTRLFNQADADGNRLLDEAEFATSHGAHPRPVVTTFRFNALAGFIKVADRGIEAEPERGITLDVFIATTAGTKLFPNRSQQFYTADADEDGFLDLGEYISTRVSGSGYGNAVKAFNKIDKDDDGFISPAEWGITVSPV